MLLRLIKGKLMERFGSVRKLSLWSVKGDYTIALSDILFYLCLKHLLRKEHSYRFRQNI